MAACSAISYPKSTESNEFVKAAYTINVGEVIELIAKFDKDKLYNKIEEKFGEVAFGSVISLFYSDWALVSPLNALGSIKITDYAAVLLGKKSAETVFGGITVGELIESFVPDKYENNEFVKAVYDVTVGGIDTLHCGLYKNERLQSYLRKSRQTARRHYSRQRNRSLLPRLGF